MIAGQDATESFFSLHRYEILNKPQYKRLIIGRIEGEESVIYDHIPGDPSIVPYAEPTWLTKGYYSPYYTEARAPVLFSGLRSLLIFEMQGHRKFQRAVRLFFDENMFEDAQAREEDGKRPSQAVFDKMAYAPFFV